MTDRRIKTGIKRKFAANTAYLFINWAAITALSFLFWIVIGKLMLPSDWGIVSTFSNLVMILTTLSMLGLGAAVSKLIPEYLGTKSFTKVKSLVHFSLKVILVLSLSVMAVILLFAEDLSLILNLPYNVVLLLAIMIVFQAVYWLSNGILAGFQNMKKIATTNALGNAAKLVVSLILVIVGFGYFGPIIGLFSLTLLPIVLRLGYFTRELKAGRRKESIDKNKIMMGFALPGFVSTILWDVFNKSQSVIISALKGVAETGLFSLAMTVTSPVSVLPEIFSAALFPITSQLSVDKNGRQKQKHLVESVFRYSLFISIPMVIVFSFFSGPIILLFSRSEYLDASPLFIPISLASLIYGCGYVFYSTLYAIGKPKTQTKIMIVSTLVFLLLALILTGMLSVMGMSIAYLASVILLALLSYFSIKKELGISLPWDSMARLAVASIVSFSFLWVTLKLTQNLFLDLLILAVATWTMLMAPRWPK